MALDGSATLIPSVARYFHAPQGTPLPTVDAENPNAMPGTPWVEFGHTSIEEVLSWAVEGGEETTKGTLQSPRLRVTRSASNESITVNLQQWDEAGLKLFFGSNAQTVGEWFRVPKSATGTQAALLVVVQDGPTQFKIHVPVAEIFRGDAPQFGSPEDFASLPLKVTFLDDPDLDYAYELTPLG